ncbi:MAG: efflux RND transporter periplasmic adaptor subunit [Syntrophales bacterium]|nr:efflux RND transporter periplasmic adaptor subunit [Syntrophales bacterium]
MKKYIVAIFILLVSVSTVCTASQSSTYEGIVVPVHEIELAMSLDGIVAEIFVKEGDAVKSGDRLLMLDDTLQRLEVERRKEIYSDNAEITSNKENMLIMKTLFDSAHKLYKETASVSLDEVKNLEMQYHGLQGKVNVAEARKKQERIEYDISKEVLARYMLLSPINGTITSIKLEEGEWAKTGETVITVVDTSVCLVNFSIEEVDARVLKKSDEIELRVNDGNGITSKKGTIVFVSPVADKASGLVKVNVEFENREGKVIPGGLASMGFED